MNIGKKPVIYWDSNLNTKPFMYIRYKLCINTKYYFISYATRHLLFGVYCIWPILITTFIINVIILLKLKIKI